MPFPLLAVALVTGAFAIRQSHEVGPCPFDLEGFALLGAGFAAFVFATNSASSDGWTSPQVLGLYALSVVALTLFSRHSLTAVEPPLSVAVFKTPIFALGILCMLFIQLACLGIGFVIPNYAQLAMGMGASASGLLLVPGCALGAVLAPMSGKVVDKLGATLPLVVGAVAALVACALLAIFCPGLSSASIIAFYVIFTFGRGCVLGSNMTNAIAHLEPRLRPDGNAIFNTVQQLASAVSTAVAASVVAATQGSAGDDLVAGTAAGSQQALIMIAVFAALLAACALGIARLMRSES